MSLRAPTLAMLALATSACIFGGGGDDLQNGTWEVGEATVDSNECGIDVTALDIAIPTGFYLFKEFDETFTIATLEEPEEELECEELLGVLTCDRQTFLVPLPPTSGLSVRVQLSAVIEGGKNMAMTLSAKGNCEGGSGSTGCKVAKGALEIDSFPCEVVQTFEAKWGSEDLGPLDPLGLPTED